MTADALTSLVRDLAADARLVDDVVTAAREQFPEVAGLPPGDSRRHVAALLAAGFAAFACAGEPDEADFAEAIRFGAERAALGVPIAGLLSGVHAGRSRILEIAITRGRAAGLPYDVLLQALLRLDRYGTALERHVVEGYRAAERKLNTDRRAARIRLLRHLLLGEDPTGDNAEAFGLSPAGRYHCVVSNAADPARVRAMEQVFARCGGVLAPVGGRLSGLTPRLPAASGVDCAALTVTTPPVRLNRAAEAYRLAVTALCAPHIDAPAGMRSVVDLAGPTVIAAQPLLAGFLSESLLGALDPADDFHRDLVFTALTYLDQGQRLDLTAGSLHLHPNTVRYRMRRLQELTAFGGPGTHLTVLETMRWWWALWTWSRSPGAAAGPPARPGS
jgi:hypothetical protein